MVGSISHVLSQLLFGGIKCVLCTFTGKGLWKCVARFPRVSPHVPLPLLILLCIFSTVAWESSGGNIKTGWSWRPHCTRNILPATYNVHSKTELIIAKEAS